MKLSAILISINLAATISLSSAADAATVSEKADWIKNNLAALSETSTNTVQASQVSQSSPKFVVPTSLDNPPKIHSFVPHRHLPSKHDFELLQARMDLSQPTANLVGQTPVSGTINGAVNQPLAGQISASAPQAWTNPIYAQYSQVNQSKVFPKVFSKIFQPTAYQKLPTRQSIIPAQVLSLPTQGLPIKSTMVIPEPPQVSNINHEVCPPPCLTPEQQAQLDALVEINRPGMHPSFIDLPGSHAQDPTQMDATAISPVAPTSTAINSNMTQNMDSREAPFPLNLLPKEALSEIMHRGGHQQVNAPQAYFGSWHRQVVSNNNLPTAGFRSYARPMINYATSPNRAPAISQASIANANMNPTHRTSPTHKQARQYVNHKTVGIATAMSNKAISDNTISAPKVLMYPAYAGGSRTNMF